MVMQIKSGEGFLIWDDSGTLRSHGHMLGCPSEDESILFRNILHIPTCHIW